MVNIWFYFGIFMLQSSKLLFHRDMIYSTVQSCHFFGIQVHIYHLKVMEKILLLTIRHLLCTEKCQEEIIAIICSVAHKSSGSREGQTSHLTAMFLFLYLRRQMRWRKILEHALFTGMKSNFINHHIGIYFQLFSILWTETLTHTMESMGTNFHKVGLAKSQSSQVVYVAKTVPQFHYTMLSVAP